MNLFEKPSLPNSKNFLYYVSFKDSSSYFVLNPFEDNVSEEVVPDNRMTNQGGLGSITYFETHGIYEKFKLFIATHLTGCDEIQNLVNSEFYTIHDLPAIIKRYNTCFE